MSLTSTNYYIKYVHIYNFVIIKRIYDVIIIIMMKNTMIFLESEWMNLLESISNLQIRGI